MRRGAVGLALLALLAAASVRAEIRSSEECETAIAADPRMAREDAALWSRSGGGVEARVCEAAALEALGATATAAQLLTGLAENTSRAMPVELRAALFEDAGRLWLLEQQPELARQTLARADALTPAAPGRLELSARAAAAEGDWPAALGALDALVAAEPENAGAFALRAAALRRDGQLAAAADSAETALSLSPDLPAGLFEAGAAAAERGDVAGASEAWQTLILVHPEDPLTPMAQRNLQRLAEGAPAPSEPRPRPRDPHRP